MRARTAIAVDPLAAVIPVLAFIAFLPIGFAAAFITGPDVHIHYPAGDEPTAEPDARSWTLGPGAKASTSYATTRRHTSASLAGSLRLDTHTCDLARVDWTITADGDRIEHVDNATADGVLVVVAAGNEHVRAQQLVAGNEGNAYDTELCCPGQSRSAITVGSHTKRQFTPAPSSSNGPTAFGMLKPDLVAPGVQIMSTLPLPRDPTGVPDVAAPRALQFGVMSGTSMATPVLAGACAILIERTRRAGASTVPSDIRKLLLTEHVQPAGGPRHVMGDGRPALKLT